MDKKFNTFENGSTWLRADFHLHTKADKEFTYKGEDASFVSDYVNRLHEEEISIGLITNHNKFDLKEFKKLRKKALDQEIYLIPGVEFSATDGAKGIHVLIAFNEDWIYNKENENYIGQFLNAAFTGIPNPDTPPYPNSNYSLKQMFDKLNEFRKDYFFILAHVDDDNGMFKELKGRNLESFVTSEFFQLKVLGIQKSRSRDNFKKLEGYLGNERKIPAPVEGTDSAHNGIEGIGTGNCIDNITQKTYLKIGAFNFEAIKYALSDKKFRQKKKIARPKNGYIKSIHFEGGKLENTTLHLSHSMNNLIGIRGSGKSSILEIIRYALDLVLDEKQSVDFEYKNNLINALLGSGGKITSVLVDDQGKEYIAKKTLGNKTKVYKDGIEKDSLKPEAIVKNPIYYGQKDLSQIGNSLSIEYFINKLIGNRLSAKKEEIEKKKQDVLKLIAEQKQIETKVARKEDIEAKHAELKVKIEVFKEKQIDKKLEKQISFDKDSNFIKRLEEFEREVISGINECTSEYEDSFQDYKLYKTKENKVAIDRIKQHFDDFENIFLEVKSLSSKLHTENLKLQNMHRDFNVKYEALKEEFSKIKREINLPNIQADDYVKYTKELDITKAQLSELDKLSQKKVDIESQLKQTLGSLQTLWHNEFKIVEKEINKVNKNQDTIEITVEFKANKKDFKSYLQESLRGSNLREDRIKKITGDYNDLIAVYEDLDQTKTKLSENLPNDQLNTFRGYFKRNMEAFLTYRVPDKFDITYQKRSLDTYSLGQRASALIIFLFTLKESDLVIIDQPEDDLDNQTIYNDVIKKLKELKESSQFIFATHNANIPVLGDCEQVISCKYHSNSIKTTCGSIDNETIRKEIVNIMEGGLEAFNNRKRIYELWTH